MNELGERPKPPVPLMRLRVDYTPPDGGNFDCENPQRITSELNDKIANVEEVILFHQKKKGATRAGNIDVDLPDKESLDSVKVEELVREFLTAQSLTVLPQNFFGDSVNQFVAKDDKHAMEIFVDESLSAQVKNLLKAENTLSRPEITEEMENYRVQREKLFREGAKPAKTSRKLKLSASCKLRQRHSMVRGTSSLRLSCGAKIQRRKVIFRDTPPRTATPALEGEAAGSAAPARTAAASTRKAPAKGACQEDWAGEQGKRSSKRTTRLEDPGRGHHHGRRRRRRRRRRGRGCCLSPPTVVDPAPARRGSRRRGRVEGDAQAEAGAPAARGSRANGEPAAGDARLFAAERRGTPSLARAETGGCEQDGGGAQ